MLYFPDCSTVHWGAPRLVAGIPRLVVGAPRLVTGAPRLVAGAPRLVAGAPRLVAGAPRLVAGLPRLVAGTPGYSQACGPRFQAFRQCSQVLPSAPKVLSVAPRCSQTYHNHSHGTAVAVIRDPSYSEGRPECPPRVWYSPDIDASQFTLHILSDSPGVFQWLKYILLMEALATSLGAPIWSLWALTTCL